MTSCLPARREEVGAPPPDRPLHHPRPGIYDAVLRSDLWALPALGTGHRLGIQNAPAGGPSQIRSDQISEKMARGKLRGLSNSWPLCVSRDLERRPPAGGRAPLRQKGPLREGLCALALSAPALQEGAPQSARPVPRAVWASAGVGHRPRGAAGEAARLHFERATLTPSRGGGQHRSSAATFKLVGILVERRHASSCMSASAADSTGRSGRCWISQTACCWGRARDGWK